MFRVRIKDQNKTPLFWKYLRWEMGDALDQLGKSATGKIQSGFEKGSDALGRPWAPLAESTIRAKGHDNILVDSDLLRKSYTHSVNRSALRMTIGTEVPYALFHEFGTERMPARPVLIPAAEWMQRSAIRTTFGDAIDQAAQKAGVTNTSLSVGDVTDYGGVGNLLG